MVVGMIDLRNRRGAVLFDVYDRALLCWESTRMCDEAQEWWRDEAEADGIDVECAEWLAYEDDVLAENYNQCLFAYSVSREDADEIHQIVKKMKELND